MKIVQLKSENVKKIKAVEVTPKGNLVGIGGDNGQGKTSLLDSIAYALSGKSSFPKEPIRRGESKAQIVCDLGDIIVTRVITENSSRLVVSNRDGAQFPSPQNMLDELVGELTFDPLGFIKMDSARQIKVLRKICGVGEEYDNIDYKIEEIYNERRALNSEYKRAEGVSRSLPAYDDVQQTEPVSVVSLMEELDRMNAGNKDRRDYLASVKAKEVEIATSKETIAGLEKKIAAEKSALSKNKKKLATLKKKPIPEEQDTSEIKAAIKNAGETNRKIAANAEVKRVKDTMQSLFGQSKELSSRIEELRSQKEKMISDAKFPIAGLSFDSRAVKFNGIDIDQLSGAEQLRVSVAMGIAMNPKLKILLVRDGSLLDEKSLEIVSSMAKEADAQIWIERVGKGEECQVIIEDGMAIAEGTDND